MVKRGVVKRPLFQKKRSMTCWKGERFLSYEL